MIYRAHRAASGGPPVIEHCIVDDEAQERLKQGQGWVRGPDRAVQRLEHEETELARAAAERAYADQRLTPKAQAEAAAVDEATSAHLGEITETPIKRSHHAKKETS